MTAVTLRLDPVTPITGEQFYQLCQTNPDAQLELTSTGELVVMPPTGGESGRREADLLTYLGLWNHQSGLGVVFSSSTMFILNNGAYRSPDAAWIRLERWNALTPEEREGFCPICPDFVAELRSPSDGLKPLQQKMQEYMDNGVRLGWLLNPQRKQIEIYRPGQDKQVLSDPSSVAGEDVLPGFVLDLRELW